MFIPKTYAKSKIYHMFFITNYFIAKIIAIYVKLLYNYFNINLNGAS